MYATRSLAPSQVRPPHPRRPRRVYVHPQVEKGRTRTWTLLDLGRGPDNDGGGVVGVARAPGPGRRWIAGSQTLPRGALRRTGFSSRQRVRETLLLPRSSLRRRHAQIPRGPREGGPQSRREEGVAAPHFWTAEVERTDARRGPRALRGVCRRPPRGARLPSSLSASARGEAGSGTTDP